MSGHLEKQFLDLLESHQRKIFRLCRAYLYAPQEAEDLYQEVLINIWRSLPGYKGTASLATWVYRVTVNTAITFNKKTKKQQVIDLGLPKQVPHQSAPSINQEQEEQLRLIHQAIAQLPPQDRLIIGLYLEDVAYKEIAAVIGATTNLVGVRINRIKNKLTKKLNPSS